MTLFKNENWLWCELCDTIAYRFECCNHLSCSGGGCDKCQDMHEQVRDILNNGEISKERWVELGYPVLPDKMKELLERNN